MEKKPKGLMPKVELIIILVFVASFLIWAISKCSNSRQSLAEAELSAESPALDTLQSGVDTTSIPKEPPKAKKNFQAQRFTRLYIVIDGLNLRETPELESEVLVKLPLYEEVYFLNEVTDSTFQINLGYEVADEPWVKVRTKKGHEGWVYGAGVHYYKKKRSGVME